MYSDYAGLTLVIQSDIYSREVSTADGSKGSECKRLILNELLLVECYWALDMSAVGIARCYGQASEAIIAQHANTDDGSRKPGFAQDASRFHRTETR
jgi:hypothetical protein